MPAFALARVGEPPGVHGSSFEEMPLFGVRDVGCVRDAGHPPSGPLVPVRNLGSFPPRSGFAQQQGSLSGVGTAVALEVNHQTEELMITMFFIGLVGAAVILGMLPFLAFSLMLETCEKRRTEDRQSAPVSIRSAG